MPTKGLPVRLPLLISMGQPAEIFTCSLRTRKRKRATTWKRLQLFFCRFLRFFAPSLARMKLSSSRGRGWGLWVAWLFGSLLAGATETDDLSEKLSETALPFTTESSSSHVNSDKAKASIQYRTAEIADAMMGHGVPEGQPVLLSVIPGETKERQVSESDSGTCDAVNGECSMQGVIASLAQPGSSAQEQIRETAVVLEAVHPSSTDDSNSTDGMKTPKVNCEERNIAGITNFTLQILNISQDLMEFLNPNGSDCTLVLFYTPWCRFSANLAPHFNSLPRAFPTLHFLALDASQHSSLSTRFGTVAVPNILLFQGAKPMARFNHTDRTLDTLKAFIFNQTGIEPKIDVVITEEDQEGPLPSTLTKGIDWLLLFSLLFLISFIMYATVRTESIRWLIPGHDQEHQE
ncbi:thioredoxin domain-containing protein 15 [Sphaerodactylus townsendi]|uniref:Thioredoxin domain-containing protein 15 n=1 Tax=Sphaerodactylus townsendi TaxID=933632 RepID=A0ACB8EJ28_9SAUR|nr:thioredoxin domain-containing protein 15 [Sphaerodactylus townsendi]